jgi:ankyrin repeat protein
MGGGGGERKMNLKKNLKSPPGSSIFFSGGGPGLAGFSKKKMLLNSILYDRHGTESLKLELIKAMPLTEISDESIYISIVKKDYMEIAIFLLTRSMVTDKQREKSLHYCIIGKRTRIAKCLLEKFENLNPANIKIQETSLLAFTAVRGGDMELFEALLKNSHCEDKEKILCDIIATTTTNTASEYRRILNVCKKIYTESSGESGSGGSRIFNQAIVSLLQRRRDDDTAAEVEKILKWIFQTWGEECCLGAIETIPCWKSNKEFLLNKFLPMILETDSGKTSLVLGFKNVFHRQDMCVEIARRLLRVGGGVSAAFYKTGEFSRTPLQIAVLDKNMDYVRFLVTDCYNQHQIDEQDLLGNTALHYVALLGMEDTCHFLIEHGAADDILNYDGQTPDDIITQMATEASFTESEEAMPASALALAPAPAPAPALARRPEAMPARAARVGEKRKRSISLECVICLDDDGIEEPCVLNACGHIFCKECVSRCNLKCPTCRKDSVSFTRIYF